MLKKKYIRRTLALVCMTVVLLTYNAAHAGIKLEMISVNDAKYARLITRATTTKDLETELKKHKIKRPNDEEYDFAAKLFQPGSGLIAPASISCGSAVAIIAINEKNDTIARVADMGYRKYKVKIDRKDLLPEPLVIPKDNVIVFEVRSMIGDEICNKPSPLKTVSIILIKDKPTDPTLEFQAKTADPNDSFVVVGYVKDKKQAIALSHAASYEEYYENQPKQFTELVTDRDIADTKQFMDCNSDIIVTVFNKINGKRIKLKDKGYDKYEVLLNNVSFQHQMPIGDYEKIRIKIYEEDEPINVFGRKVCQAEQNKLVTVELATPDDRYTDYYIRRDHRVVMYHSNVDIDGLWFPIGIIAGKPRKTENGIIMSAFPISAAFGTRFYNEKGSFYTGLSLITSYGLGETNKEQNTTGGDTKAFHGAALGMLVDLNSYVYLMGAYQWSFVKDTENPGWLIGFGFGAKLGSMLSGK